MARVRVQSFCIVHPDSEFEDPKFSFSDTQVWLEPPSGDSYGGSQSVNSTPASSSTCQRPEGTTIFDRVFAPKTSQEKIFQVIAKAPVFDALDNFVSAAFIAVGATGGGKTFAVTGGAKRFADRGLIPRSISALFEALCARCDRDELEVAVSFYELYKDGIVDLLSDKRRRVAIHSGEAGPVLVGLLKQTVATESDAYHLLFQGDSNRHFERLPMNAETSRGHVFYVLHLTHQRTGRRATLSFIDLAAVVSTRNQATAAIAQSLDALKAAVTAMRASCEPVFYASTLTQLLQPWMRPQTGSEPVHVALISPIRFTGHMHKELHEWLSFAQLFQEALSGTTLNLGEASGLAEEGLAYPILTSWPPKGEAECRRADDSNTECGGRIEPPCIGDDRPRHSPQSCVPALPLFKQNDVPFSNTSMQIANAQESDNIRRTSVATFPERTCTVGSRSSVKGQSIGLIPASHEFDSRGSTCSMSALPGTVASSSPLSLLQPAPPSVSGTPQRTSILGSSGGLEGIGTAANSQQTSEYTSCNGAVSGTTTGPPVLNAPKAPAPKGTASYAVPAAATAWVPRAPVPAAVASTGASAAASAVASQRPVSPQSSRPMSPQGSLNPFASGLLHQGTDGLWGASSRANSRSPSPLCSRSTADGWVATRMNVYAQAVRSSVAAPPTGLGGSSWPVSSKKSPLPPHSALLPRQASPQPRMRVVGVPQQTWSPQQSRSPSPQPSPQPTVAGLHAGIASNPRGIPRSLSPQPGHFHGITGGSASTTTGPLCAWSSQPYNNGYVLTPASGRAGSMSPMRPARSASIFPMERAPKPLIAPLSEHCFPSQASAAGQVPSWPPCGKAEEEPLVLHTGQPLRPWQNEVPVVHWASSGGSLRR